MMFRPSHVVVAALSLIAGGCSLTDNFAPFNFASVRLVNDTDTPLSVTNGGVLDPRNANLGFGQTSLCLSVNVSGPNGLAVANGVTGAPIAFAPSLTAGAPVTIVAFNGPLGNILFATLNDRFVPATNDAGLRFFNGAPSAGSLRMQRNGGAITPFVSVGTSSSFVSVSIDSASITFADQFAVVLDAGRMAFAQNSTVVVGSPAPGTAVPLRFFTSQGC